jgi:hypothetical protein
MTIEATTHVVALANAHAKPPTDAMVASIARPTAPPNSDEVASTPDATPAFASLVPDIP